MAAFADLLDPPPTCMSTIRSVGSAIDLTSICGRSSEIMERDRNNQQPLVSAAGYEPDARPRVEFIALCGGRGRAVFVPSRLPQLPAVQALATVELPLTLN